MAKSDQLVAFSELFWPRFIEFEGHILRAGFDLENFRSWERGGHSRASIEAALNYFGIGDLFTTEEESDLVYERIIFLGRIFSETHEAKLRRDFPERQFEVQIIAEDGEYALTFFEKANVP